MLHLLPDFLSRGQLIVGLSTADVAVISQHGLIKRVIDQHHVSLEKLTDKIKADEPIWHHAINQLDILLNAIQVKPNTQLQIVLASDFVRYLVLPPQKIYMSSHEKLAYADAAFREIYGATVDAWKIKLNDTPPHQSAITAAIDEKLLGSLNRISIKYQLKLNSIQPYLMSAYNSLASQLGKTSGYLVIVEFKRILLIQLQQGNCQNLRAYAVGNDWQAELNQLMLRESLLGERLTDRNNCEVLVYAPAQKTIKLMTIKGWNVRRISTLNKQNKLPNRKLDRKNAWDDRCFTMLESIT